MAEVFSEGIAGLVSNCASKATGMNAPSKLAHHSPRERPGLVSNCARPTRVFRDRALREVRDATNKEHHACARARDGERPVS